MKIFDSLAPGRFGSSSKSLIFKLIIQYSGLGTHCEISLRWNPQNLTKGNIGAGNGLVPSGCQPLLSECWPRSMSPYGINWPECVECIFAHSLCFQKLRTVRTSHDQVLSEMERINHQLKEEQNRVLHLENELRNGSANQRRIVEVWITAYKVFLNKCLMLVVLNSG